MGGGQEGGGTGLYGRMKNSPGRDPNRLYTCVWVRVVGQGQYEFSQEPS